MRFRYRNQMDRASSSRHQYWCVWLTVAVIILLGTGVSTKMLAIFGIGAPHGPSTNQQQQQQQPDSKNKSAKATTLAPTAPINNYPSEEIIGYLRSRIEALEASNQELKSFVDVVKLRMERVEDAAFSDGSNAFVAVMENAFFSPTGKRWVKLCDWDKCQFQTLSESLLSLLSRFVRENPTGSTIRAIQLVESCPAKDNIFTKALLNVFGKNSIAIAMAKSQVANCTGLASVVGSYDEVFDMVRDKSVEAITFEGNGQEHVKPILGNLLRNWSVKLKVGGVAVGQDYVVTKPFNSRWKPRAIASLHEIATKKALDDFRTGDDNELGQDDTIRVGGGSLWYFTKIRPSLFGR